MQSRAQLAQLQLMIESYSFTTFISLYYEFKYS